MSESPSRTPVQDEVQLWLQKVIDPYPNPAEWDKRSRIDKRDAFRFARLWLSEGIPFAFRDAPLLFERGREQLSRILKEDPKHFSVTGSGRLGYSLAPSRFSRPFSVGSDLDLFAVSPTLFDMLASDAKLFAQRLEEGVAVPKTEQDKRNWPSNVQRLREGVEKGFIHSPFVPITDNYPTRRKISDGVAAFNRIVTGSPDAGMRYRSASLRVYRDWDIAISQIGGSLLSVFRELGYTIDPPVKSRALE